MFVVPIARPASLLTRFDRLCAARGSEGSQRAPSLDIVETDRGYAVSVDLPGVAKEDVRITIEGRQVKLDAQPQSEPGRKDGERLIYRERAASRYARSFTLPEELDQEASQARLVNGVLTLSLAKKRAAAARQVPIN